MYTEKMIQTQKRSLLEITESVKQVVTESGVKQGVAVVSAPTVDAGILCTSFYDKKGHEDIMDDFNRIWPARLDYDGADDPWQAAAQSKAAVAGQTMDFIVADGELKLGDSQGIFFAEYCGGQQRRYTIMVFGV